MNTLHLFNRGSRRNVARKALLPAGIALLFGVSCSNAEPTRVAEESSPTTTGSVSLALTTAGGIRLDAFNYSITGANFSQSAPLNVKDSTSVSAIISGIPVGEGYTIALTGESQSPKASCSGSSMFAITAGAVTSVPVAIQCRVETAHGSQPVPIPPLVPVLVGSVLLAVGVRRARARK